MPASIRRLEHIPPSHQDLLERPLCGVLTTVMPDGQPQSTVVWFDVDTEYLLINTMQRFRKAKNMQGNPKVTLLVYDPDDPLHNLEIRGEVASFSVEGAMPHLDHLSQRYTGTSPYFGKVIPAEFQATEIPVLFKIRPLRIRIE